MPIPQPLSEERRAAIERRTRVLRGEMRRDGTFVNYLAIVSPNDARRMENAVGLRAAYIARREDDLAHSGKDSDYIQNQVATEKLKVLDWLQPGSCQVCQENGKETDRLIRTCATLIRKHWYHEECLRELFLEAAKCEEHMPPTCCEKAIHEALGFQLLADAEIQAFKDKQEEKSTVTRAAPTLVTLEEHYKATLAGELGEPKPAFDKGNSTSKAIASSLDVNDKLEPNKPVPDGSATTTTTRKRKISVPAGRTVMTSAR
ncbi:MAG: hypothetical protein Q9166_004551 [cf. Caloplaca sp. 2 TL-2023]